MPRGLWWVVEVGALAAFLCMPAIVFTNYAALPETIATHFGMHGTPDGFGSMSTLILLLVVGAVVFALLSVTPFYPELINVPGPRTEGRIAAAISMTRVVKFEVAAFLSYVVWSMVRIAQGRMDGVGIVPPVFSGLFLTGRNADR